MRKKLCRPLHSVSIALFALLLMAATVTAGPPEPATDAEIAELLKKAGDAGDYGNAAMVYVLDEADVRVQKSGLATTESCQVIKILADAAIRSQSVLRRDFDPDTNRVAIRSVRIHRAGGEVEEVPVSEVITQPTQQGSIFWGGEQHLLSIPRLEIGDGLEIRTSKVGFNIAYLSDGATALDPTGLEPPMEGHWYESTNFEGSYPIIRKRYSVHMPADMPIQYEVYNGTLKSSLWFDDDHHVYTFIAEDVPAVRGEAHMVSRSDCTTKLVMATVPDWEMKSRWFYEVNEPQFDADDAIRAKVEELTTDLDDEEAKIAACLHWAADNVRYYGTSRGPREGFTLHTGIETFRDKGGVCKDKAGMLVTMLRVLGHEVYPALTMAGSRVEAIPADQFNHTVTVMRNPDGTFRILDPTWSPLSKELWSSREALQGLVYGTPEGQTLTRSPYFPPEDNKLQVKSSSTLESDGTLRADLRMDLTGYPCTYLRRNANRPRHEHWARFEERLNIAPNARIEKLDYIDPRDYSQDGWLEMEVSAPGYAAGNGSAHLFRLPMMHHPLQATFIPDLFYGFPKNERQFGLRLRATRLIIYEETIKLPEGWKVVEAPKARSCDSPSASMSFQITPGEGELTYRFQFTLRDHIVPAENYDGFREAIEMMNAIADEWVVCTTENS